MIEIEENQNIQEMLPDELREMIAAMKAEKQARIDGLGKTVAKMRDAAVLARKSSGIETIWREDEEYYQGIDDANRGTTAWTKAAGVNGGLEGATKGTEGRCTAFFNLTRPFVDAASARMGDILLPATDWNFAIKPTPVPEIADQVMQPMMPQAMPGMQPQAMPAISPMAPQGMPQQMPMQPAPPGQQPLMNQPPQGGFFSPQAKPLTADQRVEKAEKRIHDWLTECAYHAELRKVIHDMAKVGTGVIKGPVASKKKTRKTQQNAIAIAEEIAPISYRVDPSNFFPDPNCGENIHNGEFVIERDLFTARKLRDLKGIPGYLEDCIDKVLEEGPGKRNFSKDGIQQNDTSTQDDDRFEVWYFHGFVDADDLASCGVSLNEEGEESAGPQVIPAVVTLVNDTVIRANLNPLESGEFPYDVVPWQRRSDSVWGVGVARQGRTPQEMLNASARAMMDNAGNSSGPQLIIRQNAIVPADGDWTIRPNKLWIATHESDTRPVGDAIISINIPMMQQELSNIIMMAKKEMEDATGVSFLLMGQQGSAPDTVGGMELVNKNASAFLREKARIFDEMITEPHIKRYNDWLQMYGPDEEKGEVVIRAVGSSSLVEREIQSMETMQILQMSANPAFGLDPAKAIKEFLRAKRFDPVKFELDEEQKAKMAQMQPPPPPQVQAAQINAQASIQRAEIAAQATIERAKMDTDRDSIYVQSEMQRSNSAAQIRIEELRIKREIAYLELQIKKGIEIDSNKVKLADTAMKLRVQKELAAQQIMAGGHAPQVANPPLEPAGRAQPGMAYQQ